MIKDNNRQNIILRTSKVGEVVPEFFQEDNSKLISFLEKYYDYLDSDVSDGFGYKIQQLINARDAQQTTTDNLDALIQEIGNGLKAASFFQKPRLMTRLLGDFYRAKGSLNSAEGFFKGFFGVDAEVEYPKQKLFTLANSSDSDISAGRINGSAVGYESQKFLTNAGIYQTFSILIKCGLSTVDYENLYKRFVHPAGFHFAGEVQAINEGILSPSAIGLIPDSSEPFGVTNVGVLSALGLTLPLTAFIDSGGRALYDSGDAYRVRTDQNINTFSTITAQNMTNYYSTIAEISHPNSFTFDDSSAAPRPDMSFTVETMDNEIFTTYKSDSAY